MSRPVVTIRPEPGCSATVEAGRALGMPMAGFPLSSIEPVAWEMPGGPFDGLLLGSANALRHAGPAADRLAGLPVYAVGEATAAAALERGMRLAAIGTGGLQNVLESLAGRSMRLLRLGGEARVPLDPPTGIEIVECVAYRSAELPIPSPLAALLGEGAIVLVHSAAAARHFACECDRLDIQRTNISIAALGPRIAEAAGVGWQALRSPAQPNDPALLALAREMCHEPFVG